MIELFPYMFAGVVTMLTSCFVAFGFLSIVFWTPFFFTGDMLIFGIRLAVAVGMVVGILDFIDTK